MSWKEAMLARLSSLREREARVNDQSLGLTDPIVEGWDRDWKQMGAWIARHPLPEAWQLVEEAAERDSGGGVFGTLTLAPYIDASEWDPERYDLREALVESMALAAARWPATQDGRDSLDSEWTRAFLERIEAAPGRVSIWRIGSIRRCLAEDVTRLRPANAALHVTSEGDAQVRLRFDPETAASLQVHLEDDLGSWLNPELRSGYRWTPDASGTVIADLPASENAGTRLPIYVLVERKGHETLAVARLDR